MAAYLHSSRSESCCISRSSCSSIFFFNFDVSDLPREAISVILWVCYITSNILNSFVMNVQRRATKMVPELRNLEYTDRLRAIKLPSMYYRRARGDMIEVYKYLHGKYNVEEVPLLLDEIRVTRGHSRRLKKERVQTRQRRNHFRHRTVNRWNSLTEEVVSAPSLNSFKSRLDELWRGYSYIQNDCFPVRTHRREDQLTGF